MGGEEDRIGGRGGGGGVVDAEEDGEVGGGAGGAGVRARGGYGGVEEGGVLRHCFRLGGWLGGWGDVTGWVADECRVGMVAAREGDWGVVTMLALWLWGG